MYTRTVISSAVCLLRPILLFFFFLVFISFKRTLFKSHMFVRLAMLKFRWFIKPINRKSIKYPSWIKLGYQLDFTISKLTKYPSLVSSWISHGYLKQEQINQQNPN